MSADCRNLLLRLLERNPETRITFTQFFSHGFVDLEHMAGPDSLGKAVSGEGRFWEGGEGSYWVTGHWEPLYNRWSVSCVTSPWSPQFLPAVPLGILLCCPV